MIEKELRQAEKELAKRIFDLDTKFPRVPRSRKVEILSDAVKEVVNALELYKFGASEHDKGILSESQDFLNQMVADYRDGKKPKILEE